MRKRIVFIADSLEVAYRFRQVLAELDADVAAASTTRIRKLFQPGMNWDLVVFEARGRARGYLDEVVSLVESGAYPLLVVVDEEDVAKVRLPMHVSSDFVVHGAGELECWARVRRLLGEEGRSESANVVAVDDMTVNLDTYQVTVAGDSIDFTYLEYALLAYLVRHPDRTFTRDVLLQQVWGFDYYGGSRTVDVHVRRIRSKLGPNLAQHLETVRGVGYLWNSGV